MSQPADPPAEVAAVFAGYPEAVRARLLAVRALIFQVAATTPGVGALTETLKWGEPAYLTAATKSGSTVRLGWKPSAPARGAVYFDCKTTLVDGFRVLGEGQLSFEGNRAILLDGPLDEALLATCLAQALTYHLRKRRRAA